MGIVPNDYIILKEAEKNGLVVAMGSMIEIYRTDLNKRLSDYFRSKITNFKGNYDETEGEVVLSNISEYLLELNEKNHYIDFPYNEGTEIHLIPIGEKIQVKLLVADEYHGSGEYSKYVLIDFFIINEQTTESDVDSLIDFLNKYNVL